MGINKKLSSHMTSIANLEINYSHLNNTVSIRTTGWDNKNKIDKKAKEEVGAWVSVHNEKLIEIFMQFIDFAESKPHWFPLVHTRSVSIPSPDPDSMGKRYIVDEKQASYVEVLSDGKRGAHSKTGIIGFRSISYNNKKKQGPVVWFNIPDNGLNPISRKSILELFGLIFSNASEELPDMHRDVVKKPFGQDTNCGFLGKGNRTVKLVSPLQRIARMEVVYNSYENKIELRTTGWNSDEDRTVKCAPRIGSTVTFSEGPVRDILGDLIKHVAAQSRTRDRHAENIKAVFRKKALPEPDFDSVRILSSTKERSHAYIQIFKTAAGFGFRSSNHCYAQWTGPVVWFDHSDRLAGAIFNRLYDAAKPLSP